jgi:hypothetical protein
MSGVDHSIHPRKRAYRAAANRHGLIVNDLRDGRLAALIGDLDVRGPASHDVSPIVLLDVAAVRALRDDLDTWLTHGEFGAAAGSTPSGGGA